VGETANLTAIPAPGQDFLGWSGDAVGNQSPLPVLMTQSKTVTATFTRRPRLRVGTSLEGLIESGFRLTVTNVAGGNYQMLGSTDLQNWSPLGYLTNTYGVAQFTDSAAINLPAREYRSLVLNPPATYSVTLKNLGDVAGATVPVGTVPLIQPSNLGQTAAPFTVPAAGLISLTAQNYTDIPSNTVPSGTALVPLNNIGTIAAIIGPVVHGTPTTIPVTAPLPAPISFTPNQHIYIGGYGLTLATNAPAETNLAAVADYWPDAFSVYFNPGQSLLISQNPPADLGHTSGAFQAPAINRTVQITVPDYTGTTNSAVLMQGASYLITSVGRQTAAVTLTLPFTGAPGTDILIGGNSYHIVSTNSALSLNVYPNTGSPAAGTVVPAGTAVTSTNNVASTPLGALLARFVVPTLGSTVSAKLSAPYTGPLNQTVWINGKPYQITAAGGG
jgi:hypothetical protein